MSTELDLQQAMSFYEWYNSKAGENASQDEKRRRAALFVKHVVMPVYYDKEFPNARASDRRRVYRLNLAQFNQCIAQRTPLPRLPSPNWVLPDVSVDAALMESI